MAQQRSSFGRPFLRRKLKLLGVTSTLLLSSVLYGCAPAATDSATKTTPVNPAQSASQDDSQILVSTQEDYAEAVKSLKPGDHIVLANGTWENFEILFSGKGTEDAPIRLSAETPGQVIISGQSNLRLAGEWLDVSGLVFKDGFTPTR